MYCFIYFSLNLEANQVNVKPRYVRINTNLMSRADAIEAFGKDGWEEVADELKTYDDFLAAVGKLGEAQYLSDIHVQNLFVFPSSSRRYWAEHQLVKEFKVLLQDKVSRSEAYEFLFKVKITTYLKVKEPFLFKN